MMNEELRHVGIEKIIVNPFQPRRHFENADLEELAKSIQSVGIIHPPLVRTQGEFYELVSGERRFRAAKLAGLKTIPVIISCHSDPVSAQAALIENIQRVDLNPIEIAVALKSLASQSQLNQEELARQIGKKRSTVANYLRLLTLPHTIQDKVSNGWLTMGHAKAILSLESSDKQHLLCDLVIEKQLSVRETEDAVQKMSASFKTEEPKNLEPKDCHLYDIEQKLQGKIGTRVTVSGKGGEGSIKIDYYGLNDLDRILSLFNLSDSE